MQSLIHLVRINKLLAISLLASSFIVIPQVISGGNFAANANVTVPESSTATTLYVSPPEFRIISTGTSSVVMDFSASIGQPSSWNESTQRIAVEIAITAGGSDTSTVFRGTGNCIIDLSSNANADSFGSAVGDGSTTPTGVDAAIFVLNDRTAQLTLNGEIDDILTAIQRVRIECDNYSSLQNKYVRIGAVPTLAGGECGNSDTRCGPLYYLFSTQRYYRSACSNINATTNVCNNTGQTAGRTAGQGNLTTVAGLTNLRTRAQSLTISVNGSSISGSSQAGWVATLSTRDEILLTNALGLANMIGTTDMAATWSWDTSWGGTSQSSCSTSEGNFFWLGPDTWCRRIPARNSDTGGGGRYWRLNGDQWERTTLAGLPANGGIDLESSVNPSQENWSGTTNGKGFAHFWAGSSTGIAEPNSSGAYIYGGYNAGDGVPGWDDASPGTADDIRGGAATRLETNFYVEYCSPGQPCTPPDLAVASTEILPDQTMDLRKATSKLVDAQSNWTFLSQLSIGSTNPANLVICISETNTSTTLRSFDLGFGILNTNTLEERSVIASETVTAAGDAVFESSSNAGRTLRLEGPRAAAMTVFNGGSAVSSPLRIWRPSGTYFSWDEQIEIRVVARSEIGRSLPVSICRMATAANSWVVSLRPYLLEQTVRQGEVQGNKRGQP